MQVIATAGHVDHGKSTLVRALTAMEPDRWAEERRRGMTIDLGFAWTTLPSGGAVAFVDVPGHGRFVGNMLAGVGPIPAVMLVVAADEGWMPQSQEHLAVLDTLDVRDGLLVVTKSDLADPGPVVDAARRRLAETSLDGIPHVTASGVTGAGMQQLRTAIDTLSGRLPPPDLDAPVRLWVDRAFTISGAGTVVTGTLSAGVIRVGDELHLAPGDGTVVVRGLESCKQAFDQVDAVARVAVNLRGVDRDAIGRGVALVTPGTWTTTAELDVLLETELVEPGSLPADAVAHLGSAAVPVRLRRLGPHAARLRLASPLPLHLGDRLLLRAPSSRHVAAAVVADLHPVELRRRGAAAAVAATLTVPRDADEEVRRRGTVSADVLSMAGFRSAPARAVRAADTWVDPCRWEAWRADLAALVARQDDALSGGIPLDVARRTLGLPSVDVVRPLAAQDTGLAIVDGRLRRTTAAAPELPGLHVLGERLRVHPLAAPDTDELRRLGLGPAELAHGTRTGIVVKLTDGVYVGPGAVDVAMARLSQLSQPFTVSAARAALGSTRRVVVPLLEQLDALRLTRRLVDTTRVVVDRPA